MLGPVLQRLTPCAVPWAPGNITLLPTRASITATTTTVPISTAAATRAPLLSRPGLVDCYGASAEFLAIECADCSLSFCTGRHFNKGEPFGAACIAITDHMYLLHLAMGFESLA